MACSKEVVDFTHRTDFQIYEALSTGQNICGRFFAHQVDRPITVGEEKRKGFFVFKKVAATIISFLTLYKVHASDPDQTAPLVKDSIHQLDTTRELIMIGDTIVPQFGSDKLEISGRIIDRQNDKPLSGALVKIVGMSLSANTDSGGFFCIDTTLTFERSDFEPLKLLVKCKGYNAKYLRVDSLQDFISVGLTPNTFENESWQISPIQITMGFVNLGLPLPEEYPGFKETFKYIFYGRDNNDTSALSIDQEPNTNNKHQPLQPPLSERLSAWFDIRKKIFNKWTGR